MLQQIGTHLPSQRIRLLHQLTLDPLTPPRTPRESKFQKTIYSDTPPSLFFNIQDRGGVRIGSVTLPEDQMLNLGLSDNQLRCLFRFDP